MSKPRYHRAEILQLVAAPCPLTNEVGDIYAGYALVAFDVEEDGERRTGRDIIPFGADGSLFVTGDVYYDLHFFGDGRPEHGRFTNLEEWIEADQAWRQARRLRDTP